MQSFREKILAALPHEYRLEDAPGLAIMGRADGVQPLQLQMGKASIEHDGPFTTHTVSHVASITKQFTAYIIAQLIQEGALKPQTRASEVLPNFPGCGADITVDHLVHHTSGLRDQWDLLLMAGWRLDDVITTDHIWKLIQTQQALNFEPGAEILYSNTGYSVLAKIIEHITAQDFPRVVRERITQPLGLSRTFALVDHRRIVKGRAFGYRLQSDGFARNDHSFANTGATSL
ncbi:MAG: serine hydrolase domain-containing protein, partial [Myxococcota bacterium]